MAGAIWCVVEDDRQGNPKKVMAEVLGEASRLASQLGGQTEAVWLTDKAAEGGLKQLGEWGAKRVLLVENAGLAPYRGEVWAPVLAELVQKESPQAVFGAVTTRQREAMARLAARLGAGLAADVVALAGEDGKLIATRRAYAGKVLSKRPWAKTPWLATLRPNVFKPAEAQSGAAAAVDKPAATVPAPTMSLVERREEGPPRLSPPARGRVRVAGGRGPQGPGNFVIPGFPGQGLGGAPGGFRPAV